MNPTISPSAASGVSKSPATASEPSSRTSQEPQGSSFAQTLERSRQREARDAQQPPPGDAAVKPRASKAAKDAEDGAERTLSAPLAEVLLAASAIAVPPAGALSQAGLGTATGEVSTATATAAATALPGLPALPLVPAAPTGQGTLQSALGTELAAEANFPGVQATGPAQAPLPKVAGKQPLSPTLAAADAAPLPVAGTAEAAATAIAAAAATDAARPLGANPASAGKASVPAGMVPTAASGTAAARRDTAIDLPSGPEAIDAAVRSDVQLASSAPQSSLRDESAPDALPFALPPLASAATSNAAIPATPAERPTPMSVAPALDSKEWGSALVHQLIRLSPGGNQVAELNLNPAHLGPLKVTLTVNDNQAQIMFVSAHAAVRQAVEAALPQLRETFAGNGISLGQTSVGTESRQPGQQGDSLGQERAGRHVAPASGTPLGAAFAQPLRTGATTTLRGQGSGVDTFA